MLYPAVAVPSPVRLASHFQPIISLSHQRVVGHEALLRGSDAEARPIAPMALFAQLDEAGQHRLDCKALSLHMTAFGTRLLEGALRHWLFVNVRPATFLRLMNEPADRLQRWVSATGCEPADLVVEVTEDGVSGGACLESASRRARELGCLLALDDFGAGHSNFDRVWRIAPDIVKLDRSLVQRAGREPHAARIVAQMVPLLHECGALVLMEGIETEDEAQLALDCDVDLVQGYFFGRPQPALLQASATAEKLGGIWRRFHARRGSVLQAERQQLAPYVDALQAAAQAVRQGQAMPQACAPFLQLPRAQLCYQLDDRGFQQHDTLLGAGCDVQGRRRFAPLQDATLACWARRPYFLRALEAVGDPQVTRPYLSMQGSGLCVTVSVALPQDGRIVVLCGDVGVDR